MICLLLYVVELLGIGIVAGIVGALSGLGGGVILIPALSLLMNIPIEYAAGASLIATIATSSGAASAYVKDKLTNIRIGMSLEIATTLGAIVGALAAAYIYSRSLEKVVFVAFGIVLLLSVIHSVIVYKRKKPLRLKSDSSTKLFQLKGSYYDKSSKKIVKYHGSRWWLGEGIMGIAGIMSGFLGIGSGTLKVLGMDWAMGLPMKVTTSTSNFMIGVTAAAGSAIYFVAGYIQPFLLAPTVIGILMGSYLGSKFLEKMRTREVRMIFTIILLIAGIEMVLRGIGVA